MKAKLKAILKQFLINLAKWGRAAAFAIKDANHGR